MRLIELKTAFNVCSELCLTRSTESVVLTFSNSTDLVYAAYASVATRACHRAHSMNAFIVRTTAGTRADSEKNVYILGVCFFKNIKIKKYLF